MRNTSSSPRLSLVAACAVTLTTALVATGCAAPGSAESGIGGGKYLVVLDGNTTVFEMETAISGMSSCTEQAHSWVRDDPSLAGRVRCAAAPSEAPLGFSVVLRSTLGIADGYRTAAPYRIRTSTSARCRAVVNGVKQGGNTAIVEDKCGP